MRTMIEKTPTLLFTTRDHKVVVFVVVVSTYTYYVVDVHSLHDSRPSTLIIYNKCLLKNEVFTFLGSVQRSAAEEWYAM